MTSSDDPLTPAEEEVRRLLAEARHTGPTPPDVIARLDRVLDDLAQEPGRTAPVVDLARRRRRVASLLVAAAAVVVVGVALNQVVTPQPASESSQAGASSAPRDTGGESAQKESAQKESDSGVEGTGPNPVTGDAQEKAGLFEVRRQSLSADLAVARREGPLGSAADVGPGSAYRAAGAACGADSWGRGRFVAVTYGGSPAVVVFRRPVGDTQVADLFLCGSQEPVRSVTLPAP